jgi:hypothetical protein
MTLPQTRIWVPSSSHAKTYGSELSNHVTILFTSVRIEADCVGWP